MIPSGETRTMTPVPSWSVCVRMSLSPRLRSAAAQEDLPEGRLALDGPQVSALPARRLLAGVVAAGPLARTGSAPGRHPLTRLSRGFFFLAAAPALRVAAARMAPAFFLSPPYCLAILAWAAWKPGCAFFFAMMASVYACRPRG